MTWTIGDSSIRGPSGDAFEMDARRSAMGAENGGGGRHPGAEE